MNHPRQIALDVLHQVQRTALPLDHWLETAHPRLLALGRADRALFHSLVYGTLRWQRRLDHIIDHWCRQPGKVDPLVRITLRMALFQVYHLDRIPVRAVVHSAVEMVKSNDRPWAAGFVNGVLRRATADHEAVKWPDWRTAPATALAVRESLPQWLAARWIDRWGVAEARALGSAVNVIPPVTIRANTLKTGRDALMAAIGTAADDVQKTRYAPEGIVITGFHQPLPQWPAFQDGWFQVQDEAAQLVSLFLDPRPGETLWDACAGLGTKTAHLAQLMNNQGIIWATDRHGGKLDRLQTEMRRLGIGIIRRQVTDLSDAAAGADLPVFDRILVDAPCSGLGVLQKNPDGKWKVAAKDLERHHRRQVLFLRHAGARLRPGGILVYAVCSMEPEENEAVVNGFLQNSNGFAIFRPRITAMAAFETLFSKHGYLRTRPHQHGMDGFFAAAFIKV